MKSTERILSGMVAAIVAFAAATVGVELARGLDQAAADTEFAPPGLPPPDNGFGPNRWRPDDAPPAGRPPFHARSKTARNGAPDRPAGHRQPPPPESADDEL